VFSCDFLTRRIRLVSCKKMKKWINLKGINEGKNSVSFFLFVLFKKKIKLFDVFFGNLIEWLYSFFFNWVMKEEEEEKKWFERIIVCFDLPYIYMCNSSCCHFENNFRISYLRNDQIIISFVLLSSFSHFFNGWLIKN